MPVVAPLEMEEGRREQGLEVALEANMVGSVAVAALTAMLEEQLVVAWVVALLEEK